MRRHRRRYIFPKNLLLLLVLLFFGMGVGYAVIYDNIAVEGSTSVDRATWDVHFDNVDITAGSVAFTSDPTISDNTRIYYSLTLDNPGQFCEFTFDVVNDGTLDAKLDDLSIYPELTTEQQNYLRYTVTYHDGVDIKVGDALYASDFEKILVRIEYLENDDITLYPSADQSLSFTIGMSYVQGHGNEVFHAEDDDDGDGDGDDDGGEVGTYAINDQEFIIGQKIPSGAQIFTNYTSIDWNPFFLKYDLDDNDYITSAYVGFIVDDDVYYLRGNTDDPEEDYYQANQNVLDEAFGLSHCSYNNEMYSCNYKATYSVGVGRDGEVIVQTATAYCNISSGGIAQCYDDNW